MKASGEYPTLTDLSLINLDEYLDLINLNLHIKSNEKHKQRKKKRGQ